MELMEVVGSNIPIGTVNIHGGHTVSHADQVVLMLESFCAGTLCIKNAPSEGFRMDQRLEMSIHIAADEHPYVQACDVEGVVIEHAYFGHHEKNRRIKVRLTDESAEKLSAFFNNQQMALRCH